MHSRRGGIHRGDDITSLSSVANDLVAESRSDHVIRHRKLDGTSAGVHVAAEVFATKELDVLLGADHVAGSSKAMPA
jgi:hypothetical protein